MLIDVVTRRPRSPVRAAAAFLGLAPGLLAQIPPPPKAEPIVLQGGTVHVGNGDVIAGGTVVLRGSRIEAVGKGLAAPEGAKVVDVTGRHVYPGLIDADSTLLLDPDALNSGEASLTASVLDGIDMNQPRVREQALAGGVTTVFVSPRRGLFDGPGAVIKLKPGRNAADLVLKRDVALSITFGSSADRPSMRLREWKSFSEMLAATRKYVEAWEDYDEKLGEYKKALEKAKKEEEERKKSGKKEEPAPAPAPAPEKKEAKPEEDKPSSDPSQRPQRPGGRPRRRPPQGSSPLDELLRGAGVPTSGDDAFADQGGPPAQGEPPKKDEAPKKPPRPGREPQKEMLKKVLDGKLRLHVRVSHAADVLNLIELARRYHFDFVLALGAARSEESGASELIPELLANGVHVILPQSVDVGADEARDAARLKRAGVPFALTCPSDRGATRFLALCAAAAVAGGLESETALQAVTSRAASLLGVDDRIGSLAAGKDADVVVTNGELFSTSGRVERVYIDGAQVFAQ